MVVLKHDTSWYYVFDGPRHPDGRRNQILRRGFATKKEALLAEREHMRKFDELPKHANGRTLREFIDDVWLPNIETLGYKKSMLASYRKDATLHIVPNIGDVALLDLDGGIIDDFYASLTEPGADKRSKTPKGLSGKTISNIHGTLSKVLAAAVRREMMKHNPCKDAVRPRVDEPKIQALRWDEVPAFLAYWEGEPEAAAVEFALVTGLRRGEVLGLRWPDVHWDKSRIFVEHTLLSVEYEMVDDSPKTTNSKRWVPLMPRAKDILRAEFDRRTGSQFVFTNAKGEPFHPDLFSQRFAKRMQHWEGTKITVHGLRHTFATISLTKMNMKIEALSQILGHYSTAFTADVYTHWLPDDLDEAMSGWSMATQTAPPTNPVMPTINRLTAERLRAAVVDAKSIKAVVERLGLAVSNKTYARVVALAEAENITLPKGAAGRKKMA